MQKPNRVTLRASLGVVTIAAIAALAATHPAQAASVLASVTSAVSCATTTACVSGTNTNDGPGVEGTSKSSYGVEGVSTSNDGLKGVSTSSNGVSGSSTSSSTTAFGVKGASPYVGVYGESPATYNSNKTTSVGVGVYGTAPLLGVVGTATSTASGFAAGVAGLAPGGTINEVGVFGGPAVVGPLKGEATGVEGESNSGTGVEGTSQSGFGVRGDSDTYTGVYGTTNTGYGIAATATSGIGIVASSQSSAAVAAISHNVALAATTDNSTTEFPLSLANSSGTSVFSVDGAGDVSYTGSLNSISRSARGEKVRVFGASSATPTVEDSGTSELVGGAAAVRLDPTFAASIDPHVAYRVFVTPDGDTRGLYVATKTAAGFVVRETQGGRSTLAFDYRIIATKLGTAGQRMSVAADTPPPGMDEATMTKLRATLADKRTPKKPRHFENAAFGRQ